jgi:hypothetical protein
VDIGAGTTVHHKRSNPQKKDSVERSFKTNKSVKSFELKSQTITYYLFILRYFFPSLEMNNKDTIKKGATKKVPTGTMIDAGDFIEGLEEVLSQVSKTKHIPVPVGAQPPAKASSATPSPAKATPPRPVIRARSTPTNEDDDDNVSQLSNNSMGSQSYANATYHCYHCTTEGGRYRAFRSYSTWSQHMVKTHKAKCTWEAYAQRYAPRSEEELITEFGNLDEGLQYEDA